MPSFWWGKGTVFCGCSSFASVTTPNGVTIITGCGKFKGCTSLIEITILHSLISMGEERLDGWTSA